MTRILALDVGGTPRSWISLEQAACYHATNSVAWQWGEEKFVLRGGYQNDGTQSVIETSSIIAVKSQSGFSMDKIHKEVVLSNRTLFGRDRNTCAYCGREFGPSKLSRDHIHPRSRGGLDVWTNVVTACRDCNCDKDDQTLKEAGMELLYLPYVPSHAEKLLLEGHKILNDQMIFLKERLPKNSRLN
jgi:hypothetical protein